VTRALAVRAHLPEVGNQAALTLDHLAACGQKGNQLIQGHAVRGARAETSAGPEAEPHLPGELLSRQRRIGRAEQAENLVAVDLFRGEHDHILPDLLVTGRNVLPWPTRPQDHGEWVAARGHYGKAGSGTAHEGCSVASEA
jgi:hypothetical protein